MKALSKSIQSDIPGLISALGTAEDDVTIAIERFNEQLAELLDPINEAVNTYNDLVAQARELAEQAHQEIDEYIDGRSEKWQESERGQDYASWRDSFDSLDLSEVSVDLPEPIEVPDLDAKAAMENDWQDEFPGNQP